MIYETPGILKTLRRPVLTVQDARRTWTDRAGSFGWGPIGAAVRRPCFCVSLETSMTVCLEGVCPPESEPLKRCQSGY